jgi:hypothetical protein
VLTDRSIQAFEAKSGRSLWTVSLGGSASAGNFIVK